ncbi:hypothetical protein GCM10008022_29120 [Paenibacillus hunanensis]|nr:hypothetical protein GCM10008022_29120 [Paenibacillus hunanensis]
MAIKGWSLKDNDEYCIIQKPDAYVVRLATERQAFLFYLVIFNKFL